MRNFSRDSSTKTPSMGLFRNIYTYNIYHRCLFTMAHPFIQMLDMKDDCCMPSHCRTIVFCASILELLRRWFEVVHEHTEHTAHNIGSVYYVHVLYAGE